LQHFFRNVNWELKYSIEYKGLKEGLHDFDYEIEDKFFEHIEESLVEKGDVSVNVKLEKRSSFIKLHLKIKGWLELTCDRCLENYRHKIKNETELYVKFGETENDDGENVIWLLPDDHAINLAQTIYEYISLSIPLRHIHPKKKDGKRECNKEMLKKLKNYMQTENEEIIIDPRWNALKNLKNNN